MNLPPEIKSAEEYVKEYRLTSHPDQQLGTVAIIHQRDLAIWNAAIEKAAEVAKAHFIDGGNSVEQAILNLKQKE